MDDVHEKSGSSGVPACGSNEIPSSTTEGQKWENEKDTIDRDDAHEKRGSCGVPAGGSNESNSGSTEAQNRFANRKTRTVTPTTTHPEVHQIVRLILPMLNRIRTTRARPSPHPMQRTPTRSPLFRTRS